MCNALYNVYEYNRSAYNGFVFLPKRKIARDKGISNKIKMQLISLDHSSYVDESIANRINHSIEPQNKYTR